MHADSEPEKREEDDEDDPLDDEDFDETTESSFGRGGASSTYTAEYYVKVQEQMIDKMMKLGLDLFELGQILDTLLNSKGGADFRPTDEMGKKQKQQSMERTTEISNADKTELAMPDDLVDAKIAKKTLLVDKNLVQNKKRQLLYVLIDVSGSMRTQFHPNSMRIFSRASLATVFACALVKKVSRDNGIMYLRFFDSRVSRLYQMNTPDEYEALLKVIRDCDFTGGGTSIGVALNTAMADIDARASELSKATLLLISDADDSLTLTTAQSAAISAREFSVLDVSGGNRLAWMTGNPSYAPEVLKKIAKKYYGCNSNSLDLKSLVTLVV